MRMRRGIEARNKTKGAQKHNKQLEQKADDHRSYLGLFHRVHSENRGVLEREPFDQATLELVHDAVESYAAAY